MVSWAGASGRGKTRDAKLALGAQNKGMGRICQAQERARFRGGRAERAAAKHGKLPRRREIKGTGVGAYARVRGILGKGVEVWTEIWYNMRHL